MIMIMMVAISGDFVDIYALSRLSFFDMFLIRGRLQLCAVVIGTRSLIVFSVRLSLFCEVPFRPFIRAVGSPRVHFVHSRVLRLRLFVQCQSKCFVRLLIGPAPCLSRRGRFSRMPVQEAQLSPSDRAMLRVS